MPGSDLYDVSNLGRVRSWAQRGRLSWRPRRRLIARVLKTPADGNGYRIVTIGKRTRKVHLLVLAAFVGPLPAAGQMGRHLDGNSLNCRLENLAYGSSRENAADRVRHGLGCGELNASARLTNADVIAIREGAASGLSMRSLGKRFSISAAHIGRIVNRKYWRKLNDQHS